MLTPGIKGHAALRVTTENTALAMGSGELPVLATPAVAALIEKACWQSVASELELDQGTVGTALTVAHTAKCSYLSLHFPQEAMSQKQMIG